MVETDRMAVPSSSAAIASTGRMAFGRMCRPSTVSRARRRASSAASRPRTRSTWARMTRAKLPAAPKPTPSAMLHGPNPRVATTMSASRMPGTAMSTSTNRMTTKSTAPPMRPRSAPHTSPDRAAGDAADEHGRRGRGEREERSVHGARVDIASERIRAEQVREAGSLKTVARGTRERIPRREQARRERHDGRDQDDQQR